MCNLMHTQTWMTCDCSANKHWVHVYICTSEEWLLDWAVLTSQWLVTGQETMQEIMQYQQAVSISLSLYTYKHTHTHLGRMTCDCAVSTNSECTCTWKEWLVTVQYQQAVSTHVPEKNDLWQCSINKQWVHLYLRRMTCDWAVSAWWDTAPLTKLLKKGDWQPAWSSVCGGLERRSHGLMHTRWGPIRVCTWMKTMQNNTVIHLC